MKSACVRLSGGATVNVRVGSSADTLQRKLLRGSPIGCIHRLVETGKDHLFDGIVFAQFRGRFAERDLDSEVEGKAVDLIGADVIRTQQLWRFIEVACKQ